MAFNFLDSPKLLGQPSTFWIAFNFLDSPQLFGWFSTFWMALNFLDSPQRFGQLSTFWIALNFLDSPQLFGQFSTFKTTPQLFGQFSTFWIAFNFLDSPQLFGWSSTFWMALNVLDSPQLLGQLSTCWIALNFLDGSQLFGQPSTFWVALNFLDRPQLQPSNFTDYSCVVIILFNNDLYMSEFPTYRSIRPEVFCKKNVLRNFERFTGKHLCQSHFFNKVAGLRAATLLKKRFWHRCFPVTFAKFLRTPFLQNTSGRLLAFSDRVTRLVAYSTWSA